MASGNFSNLFQDFCRRVEKAKNIQDVSSDFSKVNSDSERVSFVLKLLPEAYNNRKLVNVQRLGRKSSTVALELRNHGNQAYQNKNDSEALELYTRSIAVSPCKQGTADDANVELALAYANRSAVLFSLGQYEECLLDINRAILYSYPNKLKYKLFDRKARCLHKLLHLEDAKKNVTDALRHLPFSSLPEAKKLMVEKELCDLLEKCELNGDTSEVVPVVKKTVKNVPAVSYEKNSKISCASDCVELCQTEQLGRHIVATRNIEPGDILMVEKPYASVLLPEFYHSHCYNCMARSRNMVPCWNCSVVMFCSEECRDTSWKASHSIECDILPTLVGLDMGKMALLSFRLVTFTGREALMKLQGKLKRCETATDTIEGFNESGVYSSSDYGTIFHLVGHADKRTVSDLFKRTLMAVCMLMCLDETKFFTDEEKLCEEITSFPLFVAGILLRHLQNLPCNAHEVSELVRKLETTNSLSLEIGAAAYSTLSLINHSCDPNVVRHNHDDVAVVRAIRPIKTGEEILDNYGYHYAVHPKSDRQRKLESQYYFKCSCLACTHGWPLYPNIPRDIPVLKCQECGTNLPDSVIDEWKCDKCEFVMQSSKVRKDLETSSASFKAAFDSVLAGNADDLPQLLKHLMLLDRVVVRPWKEYNDCQEVVKQCFAMTGNYAVL